MSEKSGFVKQITVTLLCNSLVWYDYALYGHLIGIINILFFPEINQVAQLLSSFGTFAVGFFMRPIGAVFFGHIGDKYGRKIGVLLSLMMMFLPVGLIAVLPTYHSIGTSAIVLLILIRLIQGFALGGEVGNVLFLIECSPPKYRGFFGSFEVLSAVIGAAMSSVVVLICRNMIPEEAFLSWGWRVPFVIGTCVGVLGAVFRNTLGETPVFENAKRADILPVATLFSEYKKAFFVSIGIDSLEETSLYLFLVFLDVYFANKVGFSGTTAGLVHLLFLLLLGVLTLFSALLSDFFGRKLILSLAAILAIVSAYPIFFLIESGGLGNIIIAKILFVVITGFSLGPVSTAVYEIFPAEISYTGLAISRNISSALFGGMAPAFTMFLIATTGNNLSAAIPLVLVGFLTLGSLYFYSKVLH
ncbi:major facilitator family transporter [Neorickettsia risticii str. Illinois]|uniref:Major facilitator family transporter n=1 Tax=Neorickettsia risticii (strain Illinois) TaxID=434131 RepID=C6V5Q5_NEORI|nr:MFS transporter [Neorickettsia risticii]ACT69730.1 major facilitator family transporter [Neorickettsia risticii str. Illinois]